MVHHREASLMVQRESSGNRFAHSSDEGEKKNTFQLAEAQLTGLQLLCSMTAGILDMQSRIGAATSLRGRARDALHFTSEVNGASNMTQFEQRAKMLATDFF